MIVVVLRIVNKFVERCERNTESLGSSRRIVVFEETFQHLFSVLVQPWQLVLLKQIATRVVPQRIKF